jgi:hypothetical protein
MIKNKINLKSSKDESIYNSVETINKYQTVGTENISSNRNQDNHEKFQEEFNLQIENDVLRKT